MIKRVKIILLSAVLALSMLLFPACGGKAGTKVDSSKTTVLNVGVFDGGVGRAWAEELKSRFEARYSETSFEEGKKGVFLDYDYDKNKYNGRTLMDSIQVSSSDIFFAQGGNMLDYYVSGDLLVDLTDIVTEDLSEKFGEQGNIESKMDDEQKAHFKNNGKYYGLPFYNGYEGIVYDVDLFNEKNLFFAADGSVSKKNTDKGLSTGPDGKGGTFDDGLPQTYEQFFKLCSIMKNQKGVIPVSWTGQYRDGYTRYVYESLFYDYEGIDKGRLQHNAGTVPGKNKADVVKSINSDGSLTTEEITVTENNFVELAKQPGRYYGMKFFENIIRNNYYSTLSFNDTQSHVMAQADFLYSNHEPNVKPIAMLFDGSWWMSEAGNIFTDIVEEYDDESLSQQNRNFGFMPMPKVDDSKLGKAVMFDGVASYTCIRKKIDPAKLDAAKLLIQFANTDESLQKFTGVSGSTRAMNYDLPDDEYKKMTPFSKNLWDMKKSSLSIYQNYSSLEAQRIGQNNMAFRDTYSKIGVHTYNIFTNAMHADNISAADYFNGMYAASIK